MTDIEKIKRKLDSKDRQATIQQETAERDKGFAEEAKKKAEEDIKNAEQEIAEAEEKKRKVEEVREKAEEARQKTEEAQRACNELDTKEDSNRRKIAIGGALAALLLAGTVFVLVKLSKSGKVIIRTNEPTTSISDTENRNIRETGESIIIETDAPSTEKETEVPTEPVVTEPTESIKEDNSYVELTEEDFQNIVGLYVTKNASKYSNVGTEDILKFVALANIDEIVESNPELARSLFNYESKEEYLNDAAKVIGATVMYDMNVWNQTKSTNDFILVSDSIIGSQKEQMVKIESYVNKIATAANLGDEVLVNNFVSEFINDINYGDLSKLDDGVGFAAQVYIALISDCIAKDYLSQENFDMLQVLKTSEKYISNIFAVYERCDRNLGMTRLLNI